MSVEDECIARVEEEFLYEAGDTLALFEVLVSNLRTRLASAQEGTDLLRSDVKKLLVLSSSVEQPLIGLLLRRLDDYLVNLDDPTDRHIDDIDTFVDVMRGILDREIGRDVDEAEFVRSLPVRRPLDIEDLRFSDIETLVVDPKRTAAHFVERHLARYGFRVFTAHRSFEALELAVRTRPDMVLSSAVLDEMSGVDLACALAAMPRTERVPFALLTSFDPGHESLKRLPPSAALIRKSDEFGTDLEAALSRFGLA